MLQNLPMNFGEKNVYHGIYQSIRVMNFCNLEFDLGAQIWGQSSNKSKVAYLTRKLCRKRFIRISILAFELWKFKIFIWPPRSKLTSEVKGQLSQKLHIWLNNFEEKDLYGYLW